MLNVEGPAELRGEDRFFREDIRGGEGARVVVEWEPFVSSLEMLVVVVDVLVTGVTGGERGENDCDCVVGRDAVRPFEIVADYPKRRNQIERAILRWGAPSHGVESWVSLQWVY